MNLFQHIISSLLRHVPSNPITITSSGCHRKFLWAKLLRNVQSETFAENGRSYCRRVNDESAQIAGYGKFKISRMHYRYISSDNKGNSNTAIKILNDKKETDKTLKPKAQKNDKKEIPKVNTLKKSRTYAKMIADITDNIEKKKQIPKTKESPRGLLSKLPLEAVVSSLSKLERPKFVKNKVSNIKSTSEVTNKTPTEIKNPLIEKSVKKNSKKDIKTDSSKRDYCTQNGSSVTIFKEFDSKTPNKLHKISINMKNHNQTRNYSHLSPYSMSKEVSTEKSVKTSEKDEKTELAASEVSKLLFMNQQSTQQNKRSAKTSFRTKIVRSDTAIKVLRSEEMSNSDMIKENKIPIDLIKQKLRRNRKPSSISRFTRNFEEMLEKKKIENQKKNEEEEYDEKKSNIYSNLEKNTINYTVKNSPPNLPSNTIETSSSKKSGRKETKVTVIPETKKKPNKIKESIDHEYEVKRIPDALRPIEKRKDGTLIDYGLKVPTRRPRPKEKSDTKVKKTISAPELELSHGNAKINPKSRLVPSKSESPAGDRKTAIKKENESTNGNGPIGKKNKNDDGNYKVSSIIDGLVRFLKSEQTFDGKNNNLKENLRTIDEVDYKIT